MITQAMKPAAAPQGRAIRLAPGLIFLLLLTLIAGSSAAVQFPRQVTPAAAPAGVFSAQRALAHLPAIASEPHPAGSAAQAKVGNYLVSQLALLGLEADIQPFGAFKNIAARLPGSDSSGAIVVLAHYDSAAGSPGAADNGAGVAALLEVARALRAAAPLRNDVIVLFDDAEEGQLPGAGAGRMPFAGSRAFAQDHPWMADVRIAISLDTAVAGPAVLNEVGSAEDGAPNGRVVQALAQVHRSGWTWSTAAGGGTYDNYPFRQRGIMSLALEDNYAFRVQHTPLDRVEIVRPASLQQLGDQALAITRQLGDMDLRLPWGVQETFFYLPLLGLVHYPQAWDLPLSAAAALLLAAALVLALRGRTASGRGLGVGFAVLLGASLLSALIVGGIWSQLPGLLGWQPSDWPEWPEIVPPGAGWILGSCAVLATAAAAVGYRFGRRWSGRSDMALVALIPFALLAIVFALTDARLAFLPLWPVLIGALAWLAVLWAAGRRQGDPLGGGLLRQVSFDLPAWITAGLFVVLFPGFFLSSFLNSGPSGLPILAGLWAAVVFVLLPAIEGAATPPAKSL